jgi:hypothetical protein
MQDLTHVIKKRFELLGGATGFVADRLSKVLTPQLPFNGGIAT